LQAVYIFSIKNIITSDVGKSEDTAKVIGGAECGGHHALNGQLHTKSSTNEKYEITFPAFKTSATLKHATLYLHVNIFDKHIASFSGKQIDLCSSGIAVRHTYVYKERTVKYQREKKIYIHIYEECSA
jgi:hypothetical protein